MEQETFEFHEDIYEALRGVVSKCGGPKLVGAELWPHKSPDKAAHWLNDCLNVDKPAKLDPEELIAILRFGNDHGVHIGMHYLADATHYSRPSPITPLDRREEVAKQMSQAVATVKKLIGEWERSQ